MPIFTFCLLYNLTSHLTKVAIIIFIPILELKELKQIKLKLREAPRLIQGHSTEEERGGYESGKWSRATNRSHPPACPSGKTNGRCAEWNRKDIVLQYSHSSMCAPEAEAGTPASAASELGHSCNFSAYTVPSRQQARGSLSLTEDKRHGGEHWFEGQCLLASAHC